LHSICCMNWTTNSTAGPPTGKQNFL
jgi:hypothetical protein